MRCSHLLHSVHRRRHTLPDEFKSCSNLHCNSFSHLRSVFKVVTGLLEAIAILTNPVDFWPYVRNYPTPITLPTNSCNCTLRNFNSMNFASPSSHLDNDSWIFVNGHAQITERFSWKTSAGLQGSGWCPGETWSFDLLAKTVEEEKRDVLTIVPGYSTTLYLELHLDPQYIIQRPVRAHGRNIQCCRL